MYYLKSICETGDYTCADGNRYLLSKGTAVYPKTRWTWFDSEDECLEAWELTYDPLPEPEPERNK